MIEEFNHIDSLALTGGKTTHLPLNSVIEPLYLSESQNYYSFQHFENIISGSEKNHHSIYSLNPTVTALESRVSTLEYAAKAVSWNSIENALLSISLLLCKTRKTILLSQDAYLIHRELWEKVSDTGLAINLYESIDAINPVSLTDTAYVYCYFLSPTTLQVMDCLKLSKIAKAKQIPLIINNSTLSPWHCQLFNFGADIVMYDLATSLEGHGRTAGAVAIENEVFAREFSEFQYDNIAAAKAKANIKLRKKEDEDSLIDQLKQDSFSLGSFLSPMNAFLALMGLETMTLRMQRQSENASALEFILKLHPKITWVNYPGTETSSAYPLAKKYLREDYYGYLLTFDIHGNTQDKIRFINSLKLINHSFRYGTTRSQLCMLNIDKTTKEQGDFHFRLSVGIEHLEDIKGDLFQALSK